MPPTSILPDCGSCVHCRMARSLFRFCDCRQTNVYAPSLLVCSQYSLRKTTQRNEPK